MTQPTGPSGAPGQPSQGGPPPSWQQAPQQPVAPVAPPTQPPSWTANLTSTAPVAGPAGYVYGDVPNRALAFIIDYVVMFIIGVIVAGITLAIFGNKVGTSQVANTTSSLIGSLLSYALIVIYFWYTWTRMRGTVGMKLLGMQIGHEQDGRTLDDRAAVVRIVAMFGPGFVASVLAAVALGLGAIASLVAFIWFLALLYTTAQSPTKQGLHDQYAHSMVVKAARRAA